MEADSPVWYNSEIVRKGSKMPAYAIDQLRNVKFKNRDRITIGYGHPLNNPDRPEFTENSTAARALHAFVEKTLTSNEPGVAQYYWNELKIAAVRATKSIDNDPIVMRRALTSTILAHGALNDTINDGQLAGGASAAQISRDIYQSLDNDISRDNREKIINHLTTRALAEVVGLDQNALNGRAVDVDVDLSNDIDPADLREAEGIDAAVSRLAAGDDIEQAAGFDTANELNSAAPTPAMTGRDEIGARYREQIDAVIASDQYKGLKEAVAQIYEHTSPAPINEALIDIDALEEDERDAEIAANNLTRVKETQDILLSFGVSNLLLNIDRSQSATNGELSVDTTDFEMETAQEALVMEKVIGWANQHSLANDGKLPTPEQVSTNMASIKEELGKTLYMIREDVAIHAPSALMANLFAANRREKYTETDATAARLFAQKHLENEGLKDVNITTHKFTDQEVGSILGYMRKLSIPQHAGNARYAGMAAMVQKITPDQERNNKWLIKSRAQVTQRAAIFGKGSSKFEHMNAVGLFPSQYFKDVAQITELVKSIAHDNKQGAGKRTLVMPDMDTDAVKTAIAAAIESKMPIVNVHVAHENTTINEKVEDRNVRIKNLDYLIEKEEAGESGKPVIRQVSMLSGEGYRSTNGALVLLSATHQSALVGAFNDFSKQVMVAGLGPDRRADYAACNAYRGAMAQGTLVSVLNDKGQELTTDLADKITKNAAQSPLQMAQKRFESLLTEDVLKLPVSSAAARLLVENLNITSKTSEQIASLAQCDATIRDLMTLPQIVASGPKNLEPAERQKAIELTRAVPAEAFRTDNIKDIRALSTALENTIKKINFIKEEGLFNLEFKDHIRKAAPMISIGAGAYPEPDQAVLLVGGKRAPDADQLHIIDSAVKAYADAGKTVVTTAEPGFNLAVMDAAIRHQAPIMVVNNEDMSIRSTNSEAITDRILAIATENPRGLVTAEMKRPEPTLSQNPTQGQLNQLKHYLEMQPTAEQREKRALDVAGSMAASAMLGFAKRTEYVAYAVAKIGEDKPVAALPGSYKDSANKLLTQDFSSLSIKNGYYGNSITSSFEPGEDNGSGKTETQRDKNGGLVPGGDRRTSIASWDYGATAIKENETVERFVQRTVDDLDAGRAVPMYDRQMTEHQRLVKQGVIDNFVAPENSGSQRESAFEAAGGSHKSLWEDTIRGLADKFNAAQTYYEAQNSNYPAQTRDAGMSV